MAENHFPGKHTFLGKKSKDSLITQETCESPATKKAVVHLMRDTILPKSCKGTIKFIHRNKELIIKQDKQCISLQSMVLNNCLCFLHSTCQHSFICRHFQIMKNLCAHGYKTQHLFDRVNQPSHTAPSNPCYPGIFGTCFQ